MGNLGESNEMPTQQAVGDFFTATRHMEPYVPSPGTVQEQHPYRNVSSTFKFIDALPTDTPFFSLFLMGILL